MIPNRRAEIEGDTEQWPLLDTLDWLHKTGRTALLRLEAGVTPAYVTLREGVLYRADWGALHGLDALRSLMRLGPARFRIESGVVAGGPNIFMGTQEALMECALEIDHAFLAA